MNEEDEKISFSEEILEKIFSELDMKAIFDRKPDRIIISKQGCVLISKISRSIYAAKPHRKKWYLRKEDGRRI